MNQTTTAETVTNHRHLTRQDMIDLGYIPTFNNKSMKLKHFNPETCYTPVKTKDLYMVLRKNGAICFTTPTIKALNLKIGIKLELSQDQDKGDWYLVKIENGFELRSLGQQIGFSSTHLVNYIWPNRKKEDKSLHLIINETPIHYDGRDMYLITIPKK